MNKKKILIIVSVILILGISIFFTTGASKANDWKTAPDIMITDSSLSGEAQYRWISDSMIEVKYTKGHTWIVNEENVLIRTTRTPNNK